MFNLLASDGIAEIVTLSDILQRFFSQMLHTNLSLYFLSDCCYFVFPPALQCLNSSPCIDTMHLKKKPNETKIPMFQKSLIYTHLSLLTENFILTIALVTKKGGKPRLMLFPAMSDKHLGCKLIFIRIPFPFHLFQ